MIEEPELTKRFGEDYLEYSTNVYTEVREKTNIFILKIASNDLSGLFDGTINNPKLLWLKKPENEKENKEQ